MERFHSIPLRIAHVVEATGAGVGKHVMDLAELQANEGHQVTVFYSPLRADPLFQQRIRQLTTVEFKKIAIGRKIGMGDIAASFLVRKHLSKHPRFDVIHGHSSKGGAIARLASFGLRSPVVYTPHSISTMATTMPPLARKLYATIELFLSWRTRAIIAVSTAEREHIRSLGIRSSKLKLIKNGVSLPEDKEDAPSSDATKSRFGIQKDSMLFGFVGRIEPQKNLRGLLMAASLLRYQTDVPFQIAVVGEGSELESLKNLAIELGLGDHIRWLGFQRGTEILRVLDVLVIPSAYEGCSLVMLEGIASGVPLICSDVAGVRDFVTPDANGFVVPVGCEKSLASAMRELMCPDRLRIMRQEANARKHLADIRAMSESTLQLYREICNPHE